jgi:hypothetical protein
MTQSSRPPGHPCARAAAVTREDTCSAFVIGTVRFCGLAATCGFSAEELARPSTHRGGAKSSRLVRGRAPDVGLLVKGMA